MKVNVRDLVTALVLSTVAAMSAVLAVKHATSHDYLVPILVPVSYSLGVWAERLTWRLHVRRSG